MLKTSQEVVQSLVKIGVLPEILHQKEFPTSPLPKINVNHLKVNRSLKKKLPLTLALKFMAVPIIFQKECLVVAMENPENIEILKNLSEILGFEVLAIGLKGTDLSEKIKTLYRM